jgi:acetolactate synthase-1/2/3 large subunit
VLVLQDNAYGMIRWKQAADCFADFGLSFGNPCGGVHLVVAPIDYSENIRVLVEELRNRVPPPPTADYIQ